MDACTIIAKNYVAQARVLARSFRAHHPAGRFWTLVIDEYDGYLSPADEPFEILTPSDIGCDAFREMAAHYSVLELSTAVKPWLLRSLMGQSGRPITYLDPDIKVFSPLEKLDELAERHGLVLTPHNLVPIPPDGRRPSQVDIMIAGVYNLGYVTVAPREETQRLLDWWSERLRRDCRVDPARGYFVDQRWFDLAPGFLEDLCILRDPEYNVAYWNLPAREFTTSGAGYAVDGRPLAFFHFSGFDPEQRTELSSYQDRIRVAAHPALRQILNDYAAEALGAGYREARHWPYTYNFLPNGTPYDTELRHLYLVAEERGEITESPLTPSGEEQLLVWLGEQQPGAPAGINRLLAHLYGTRDELRQAYPDVSGADLPRLLRWAREEGAREIPALGRLGVATAGPLGEPAPTPVTATAGPLAPAAATAGPSASDVWGVNVVGYFRSELGVGEAARQVISALDAAGVPALPLHGETIPLSRQGHRYAVLSHADAEFPVNLICMNADALPEFAVQAGERFFAGRYSIGLWFWEVNQFREEWMPSFEHLDEVWLPTAHVAEAVAAVTPIPARTMRVPVTMGSVPARSRAQLGLPEGFLFLFSFDYRSVFARKNPLAVIDAFASAFGQGEGPQLVVKCINHEAFPDDHARLRAAAADHPAVHVIDRYVDAADKDAMTAACDCYVSLHRSEGFGYTMAEAMFCGKPVIATGYSGNLDFMTEENSLLVRHRLVPIGPGADPYPAHGEWAEPDVAHAAELMQRVAHDPGWAAELGRRGARDIRQTHSPVAAGEAMRRRLDDIRSNRAFWRRGPRPPAFSTADLTDYVARGPWNRHDPSANRAKRLWRRGVLRAMKPFVAYQQALNADLVRAIESIGAATERTRSVQLRSTAALMQAARRYELRGDTEPAAVAHESVPRSPSAASAPEVDRSLALERTGAERAGRVPR